MFDIFRGTVTTRDWLFCGGILALAVGLVAAFYFLVYTAQENKVVALSKETVALEKELQLARAYKASYQQNKEMADSIQQIVDTFEKRLPAKREIIDILRSFEEKGNQVFNAKPELVPLPPVPSDRKEIIPARVKAVGDFNQILTFINLLERDTRYFSVSDFDIKADNSGQGLSEATMTLNTFRFLENTNQTEPGKTDKPAGQAPGATPPAGTPASVK